MTAKKLKKEVLWSLAAVDSVAEPSSLVVTVAEHQQVEAQSSLVAVAYQPVVQQEPKAVWLHPQAMRQSMQLPWRKDFPTSLFLSTVA